MPGIRCVIVGKERATTTISMSLLSFPIGEEAFKLQFD